ncbi:thrombospondin-2-like [Pecten maximus]|uniref:thrombospondin-2-like n=1 Tax=Pecten maximus TaxID=6579 RepID=UPI00145916C6|nr:thrombospondin-2-like [Pecten maximus]
MEYCCPGHLSNHHHNHDCHSCGSNCCDSHQHDSGHTDHTAQWTDYGACSETCGQGTQTRYCTGQCIHDYEIRVCDGQKCAVNGGWGTWSTWSSCSASCGTGNKHRTRVCDNPKPQHGGHGCHGNNIDTESCAFNQCPSE